MKTIHTIIAASIILNVALFIFAKPFSPRPRAAPPRIQVQKSGAQNAPAFNLKTATPEQLMQKLTALGFPPDIIKALTKDRIFSIKMGHVFTGSDDPRYWRVNDALDHFKYTEWLTANREMDEIMTKLFGADYKDPPNMDKLRQQYGDLSDEKLRALAEIEDKYLKQFMANSERRAKGTATDEDKNSLKTLMAQKREALSKLLTPDELLEYNMRAGIASSSLRYETRLFDITEQEFRDMSAIMQKIYDDYYDGSTEFMEDKKRNDYVNAQYRQILGDERYADYQQAKNRDYEKLNLIVQRLDLPLSAAREVVSVQNDLTKRATAIDTDASLTNAERAEQYTALAQEAKERITQSLGERGYAAYRENSKNWIQTLEAGKTPARPRK